MALPAPIAAMRRPEMYPQQGAEPLGEVGFVQTHISYVFLAGAHVYKVKKPVRFSFLDFSTLERRRHFCHEEVRLNRRLAPDAYVGVEAICGDGAGYRLGVETDAAAVEYVVHMRRLPEDRMLDHLLDEHRVTADMIEQLARRLAEFHCHAAAGPEIAANGDPTAIWAILEDNFTNARRFRGDTIPAVDDDAIQTFAAEFLRRHDGLLRGRQATHRIRECHGDLHTEHICFSDPLIIYDCIEFNPRFRHCDVASDIAFLAMDLEYHNRPDLAAQLISRYAVHADDADLLGLVPFYACYRAYVRGKVDSLKSVEEEVEAAEREQGRQSALRHFALAYRYTWAYSPALVVLTGLSGTGKSTIATALHERTGFAHINADVVRKRLAGLTPLTRAGGAYGSGLYAPEHSERTYAALFAAAAEHLDGGRGVILDATFQLRAGRVTARDLARQRGMPFVLVECQCTEAEARHRLAQRNARGDNPSDADWKIYCEQRRRYEAIGADERDDHLAIDSALPLREITSAVEQALRARVR